MNTITFILICGFFVLSNQHAIEDEICMSSKTKVGVFYKKSSIINLNNHTNNIPTSCKKLQELDNSLSGIYQIRPKTSDKPIVVFCDMETRRGGWTVIQNRFDGSQDFYLNWRDYKFGFGDLKGEFWLGLENMHKITKSEKNELLVELVDHEGSVVTAHYTDFLIGSEWEGYPLMSIGEYQGVAGNALNFHIGQKFSTKDFDRDASATLSSADLFVGAWWYNYGMNSNLNGKYIKANLPTDGNAPYYHQGIHWMGQRPIHYSYSKSRMLIRGVN